MKKLLIIAWLASLATVSTIASANGGQVRVGRDFACAIHSNGTVWCSGDNTKGQLGFEPLAHTHNSSTVPVQVSGIAGTAVELTLGDEHACVLSSNSYVYCWGDNSSGQLGTGDTSNRYYAVAVTASTQHVSAGGRHTCDTISDSNGHYYLYCWGANDHGQLGLGDRVQRNSPVRTSNTNFWTSISAGESHTCGMISPASMGSIGGPYCWGWNGWGQLGDGDCSSPAGFCDGGSNVDMLYPNPIQGLTLAQFQSVTDIAAYNEHSCMIMSSLAFCTGRNELLQVSNETYQSCRWQGSIFLCVNYTHDRYLNMHQVNTLGGSVLLSQGPSANSTCITRNDNSMRCWGDNTYGQLGHGPFAGSVADSGWSTPTGFTSGVWAPGGCSFQNCSASAFIPTHQYMWGLNNSYQMGTGDTVPHYTPFALPGT